MLFDGDLLKFYLSLISGTPLPLTLCVLSVANVSTVMALALFLHRDLAINPATLGVVSAVRLVEEAPFWGPAHIDRDLARLIHHTQRYLSQPNLQGESITSAIEWFRDYLRQGTLPQMGASPSPPAVHLTGSDGFVLAETAGAFQLGWIELFRQGFLRGILIGPVRGDRRPVMLARKSPVVAFDLNLAAQTLNSMEDAMGEDVKWELKGDALTCSGTLITIQHMLMLATRV